MWLLLAQFAKQKQAAAQAATGANRPHVELARPRIIPHPAGTIEFEHGQIVAKIGKRDPRSEWIISPALCVVHSTGDSVERTKSVRPTGNASLLERAVVTLASCLLLQVYVQKIRHFRAINGRSVTASSGLALSSSPASR